MTAPTETPAAAVSGPVAVGGQPQCPRPAIGSWVLLEHTGVGVRQRRFEFCSLHADSRRREVDAVSVPASYARRVDFAPGQTLLQCGGSAFEPEVAGQLLSAEVQAAAADVRAALGRLSRLTAVADPQDREQLIGCERQVLVEMACLRQDVHRAADEVALRLAHRSPRLEVRRAASGEA